MLKVQGCTDKLQMTAHKVQVNAHKLQVAPSDQQSPNKCVQTQRICTISKLPYVKYFVKPYKIKVCVQKLRVILQKY